jgi:N6-adenosine-specific RNA methylase IME4
VPVSAPTLKQQVGSKNRGIGLKKLAAIPKAMVKATITKIQASGKEATVSAVIKAVDGDGKAERRAGRERELAEATRAASEVLGSKLYPVIMADPPWRFEPYSRETGMDRAADNHYPTMTRTDIGALKVPAADDCVLFLWATPAMNAEALAVMAEWGFAYKSQLVWAKDRTGTGYWARQQHELLLIGTKGDVPAPAPGQQPSSLISAPVGPHSAKPAVFHEIIEHMFPTAARLEMFARAGRPGWDSHGNEAPPAPVVGRGAAILPLIIGRGRGVISHPGADAEIRPPRRDCARRRAHENAPTFGCC